jgi:dipeptidyl aminopeptidase/acylaminoacyl peptidase
LRGGIHMKKIILLAMAISAAAAGCSQRSVEVDKPAFDVDTLLKARIVTDIVPVPGADSAVIRLRNYDGGDSYKYDLLLAGHEGTVTAITSDGKASGSFDVSPDGTRVVIAGAVGDKSGLVAIPVSGGAPSLLTELPVGADNVRWTAGGVFFTAMVFPDCSGDLFCTAARLNDKKNGSSILVYDDLFFRRWNKWRDGTRQNLFVVDSSGSNLQMAAGGNFDMPDYPLSKKDSYTVSPDGNTVIMAIKIDPDPARTTRQDLYSVTRTAGGSFGALVQLTDNPSTDASPAFSPDGTMIAYIAQDTPGYDEGLRKLRVMDLRTKERFDLASALDRPVRGFAWAPDGSTIYFIADDSGYRPLFAAEVKKDAQAKKIEPATYVAVLAAGHGTLWFTKESFSIPTELNTGTFGAWSSRRTASFNDDTTGSRSFGRVEEFYYDSQKSAGGRPAMIHTFMVYPPAVLGISKPPVLMFIHGGPEGSWSNYFFTRWSAQAYASMGFAVVMPDITGSYGYGQAFTEAVRDDWGGAPYNDMMALMEMLDKDDRVDTKKSCMAGASYGGYMANWIEGHSTRFKCLVSHDGSYDFTARYGSTDELWFPEWEYKGTPWENPGSYEKWSPKNYVLDFKTPILVIHGELDYHLPIEQGVGMYELAKIMGVEAKLMYFPDEGHLVVKPKNTRAHYQVIGDWLKAHMK